MPRIFHRNRAQYQVAPAPQNPSVARHANRTVAQARAPIGQAQRENPQNSFWGDMRDLFRACFCGVSPIDHDEGSVHYIQNLAAYQVYLQQKVVEEAQKYDIDCSTFSPEHVLKSIAIDGDPNAEFTNRLDYWRLDEYRNILGQDKIARAFRAVHIATLAEFYFYAHPHATYCTEAEIAQYRTKKMTQWLQSCTPRETVNPT